MNKKNLGFSAVEIVLVIVVVALLGFIGYRVWSANNVDTAQQAAPTASQTAGEAPQINNASDLNKASETLDNTNVNGNSSGQLESELSY